MGKIRKGKVLKNGCGLISDCLMNVGSWRRGKMVGDCKLGLCDERVRRRIRVGNGKNMWFLWKKC